MALFPFGSPSFTEAWYAKMVSGPFANSAKPVQTRSKLGSSRYGPFARPHQVGPSANAATTAPARSAAPTSATVNGRPRGAGYRIRLGAGMGEDDIVGGFSFDLTATEYGRFQELIGMAIAARDNG